MRSLLQKANIGRELVTELESQMEHRDDNFSASDDEHPADYQSPKKLLSAISIRHQSSVLKSKAKVRIPSRHDDDEE